MCLIIIIVFIYNLNNIRSSSESESDKDIFEEDEELKIIQEIQRRKAYNLVKGNLVWQRMEAAKFSKGRR